MESKKISFKMENDIQIIFLTGRLTYEFIEDYRGHMLDNIAKASGYIVNLESVEQIDSTGMGLLVNIAKHFIYNKQKMVLVMKSELIMELFKISKLNQVFEICNSNEHAMRVLNERDEAYWERITKF